MNYFLAIFGIYAAIYGFNAAGEEYFSGGDIEERQEFVSSNDDLQEILKEKSFKNEVNFLDINSTENNNNEMDERWNFQQSQELVVNTIEPAARRKKKKQHQIKHDSDGDSHQQQRRQRKRTKVRRKKQKPDPENFNSTSPVTNLIASATVIDNSIDDDGTISKLEMQKYKNSSPEDIKEFHSELENSRIQTTARIIMSNSVNNNNNNNFSNHHLDSNLNSVQMQMKRKTKYPRNGKNNSRNGGGRTRVARRRDKLRLREQERKIRLAAREEKRKLLQMKREMRKRRKFDRIENLRKRKDNRNASEILEHEMKPENLETIQKTINNNFMTAPSIDYLVEKSSNYIDINETIPQPPIDDVSYENPSIAEIQIGDILNGREIGEITLSSSPSSPTALSSSKYPTQQIISSENGSNHQVKLNVVGNVNSYEDAIGMLEAEEPSGLDDIIIGKSKRGNHNNNNHYLNLKTLKKNDATAINEGGDLSCLKDDFQPAPEVEHADIKYLRNDLHGTEEAFLEIEYICYHGYKLEFIDGKTRKNVFCKNGKWIGTPPRCVHEKDSRNFNETCNYPKHCEQACYVKNGLEKCACHKGFRMKNKRCEDINECIENTSVCEYGCINTVGSYRCKCPKGLRVGDANSCIDVNECLLRNGHGPCQDICINTWGSYKCSCDSLSGSQLSSDNHSCSDIDECSINNGGCSHTCLNTLGRAFCLCPEGWILDKDWKTCVDIDECAEQTTDSSDQRCEFGCINTPGSYSCLVDFGADQPIDDQNIDDEPECPNGFYKNKSTNDCEDINECTENNGGCFHRCINSMGSFHCLCKTGYMFAPDKYSCIVSNSTTDISCPPLFPPKHGYLECSRPIASDMTNSNTNSYGGRRRITNRPGSQCVLRCPTGFRINGKFSKQCSANGIWIGDGDGTCIRYPQPKLICPMDIVLETPPNDTMAKLRIPRPKTDVHYERDVTITPEWLRDSEIALEVGIRNITYTARHPVSKLAVSCSFTITVLEGEPPKIKYCPPTQKYSLSKQHESIKIDWNEPLFSDNVNVTEISRTNNPGNSFGVGSHQIIYVAKDQAGYTTRCVFKLLVNIPFRQTLNHPLPIYHMFY